MFVAYACCNNSRERQHAARYRQSLEVVSFDAKVGKKFKPSKGENSKPSWGFPYRERKWPTDTHVPSATTIKINYALICKSSKI